MRLISAILVIAVLGASCGGYSDNTWLAIIKNDTLTVEAAAETWNELNLGGKAVFEEKDRPGEEFVIALTRRIMLEKEVERLGYLDDARLFTAEEAYIRLNAALVYQDLLSESIQDSLTTDDIRYYITHTDRTVWYTVSPGTPDETEYGPELLANLPFQLIGHLDSLSAGESRIDITGTAVRLDSLAFLHVSEHSLTDSSTAAGNLVHIRAIHHRSNMMNDIMSEPDLIINWTGMNDVASFLRGESDLSRMDTVIMSNTETWTALDIVHEVDFMIERVPVDPTSVVFAEFVVENLLMQTEQKKILGEDYPYLLAEVEEAARSFVMETASSSLYRDSVLQWINPGISDFRYEFDHLETPIIIEEARVFRCALLPSEMLEEYYTAIENRTSDAFIESLPCVNSLSATDPPSQLTVPLLRRQVLWNMGELVFDISPDDSSEWIGPVPVEGSNGYALWRLIEVFPEHEATFDEVLPVLETMAENRIEKNLTVNWMNGMTERYGLRINKIYWEICLMILPAGRYQPQIHDD